MNFSNALSRRDVLKIGAGLTAAAVLPVVPSPLSAQSPASVTHNVNKLGEILERAKFHLKDKFDIPWETFRGLDHCNGSFYIPKDELLENPVEFFESCYIYPMILSLVRHWPEGASSSIASGFDAIEEKYLISMSIYRPAHLLTRIERVARMQCEHFFGMEMAKNVEHPVRMSICERHEIVEHKWVNKTPQDLFSEVVYPACKRIYKRRLFMPTNEIANWECDMIHADGVNTYLTIRGNSDN